MAKDGKKNKDKPAPPTGPAPTPRLETQFAEQINSEVAEQFGLKNPMSRPRLEKIIINVNMGRHLDGTKVPANVRASVLNTLETISGQKPIVLKAKRSVANFKVREGYETAAMVTLRRDHMWHFLDRLINLATPRIKDFRGLPEKSFDNAGNYSMGLTEQAVFPEIDMTKVDFTHGMHINIVFKNSDPEKSRFVLERLGMPFRKPELN
jgi:large subunit ribosomal protein L5